MSDKLTKAEIISTLTEKYQIPAKDIHVILDGFMDELKKGLVEERTIELRGFGTFEIKRRKGREKARNPKTGATVAVEDHNVAIFRPGKELKDELWKR